MISAAVMYESKIDSGDCRVLMEFPLMEVVTWLQTLLSNSYLLDDRISLKAAVFSKCLVKGIAEC